MTTVQGDCRGVGGGCSRREQVRDPFSAVPQEDKRSEGRASRALATSILGSSLHHVVVRAYEQTVTRVRNGRSFVAASSVSEEERGFGDRVD